MREDIGSPIPVHPFPTVMAADEDVFERFADYEAHGDSPLYESLARCVAGDDDLLRLAATVPDDQPAPNLFLAAVQYLLFERPHDPLASYFESLADSPRSPDDDLTEVFREFCLTHQQELAELLSTRRVQTNLVRRSAILLPVFEYLSRQGEPTPLGLVDIGTSAGLNLLWDKYAYEYGEYGSFGRPDSPVRIRCGVLGTATPPFPETMPPVGTRLGIDLNPIDVRNEDDARWLRALVWPELEERRRLTEAAISVVRESPPDLIEGDAIEELTTACERVPSAERVCLVNTHTLYQFTPDQQLAFTEQVEEIGQDRDLFWIWCEPGNEKSEVRLTTFDDGEESTELLAYHDNHGRWIEWLA